MKNNKLNKKLKKFLLTILVVLVSISLFSQQTDDPYLGFPDVLPNSPEAASLGKYGDIPVGLFTGTPNFSVPLYTIDLKGFELPIALNYNSNGIKVEQISSNVGLGWNLTCGGIITRSLNDDPDETHRIDPPLPDSEFGSQEMSEYLNLINNQPEAGDTEPDIFYFNFNGNSGKFILDENFEPYLLEPSDVKIVKLSAFGAENTADYAFKAITSDGVVYWFGGTNAIESSALRTRNGGIHPIITDMIQNAWYLKKITFPDKNDSIVFNYENEMEMYIGSVAQNVKAQKKTANDLNEGFPVYSAAYHTLPIFTQVYPYMSRISSIQWTSGRVQFSYSSRYGNGNFVKLDSVQIFDSSLQPEYIVKSFSLDYLTINCDLEFQNPDMIGLSDMTINKRLFLTSVHEVTGSEGAPNSYRFKYILPDELPPRLSYAQDYWGYFNGKSNPDLVPDDLSLFEKSWYNFSGIYYNEVDGLFNNVGGDRRADSEYGCKGLLSKIIYPTNGFDSIVYEANTVNILEHQLPQSTTAISLSVMTDDNFTQDIDSYTTDTITFSQKFVPITLTVDTNNCWQINYPTHFIKMVATIKDLTTNKDVLLYVYNSVTGQYNPVSTPLTVGRDSQTDYLMTYEKDHVYKFTISINRPCLVGGLNTSYYSTYGQDIFVNKEVGGMRVKKIIQNDNFGTEKVRIFYYGAWDSLNVSSGILEPIKPAISFFTYHSEQFDLDNVLHTQETITLNLSFSSLFSISNFQGNHINYEYVVEGFGDNFDNGAIEHKYDIVLDTLPLCFYDPILGTPNTNLSFNNGKEILSTTYRNVNSNFIISNKTVNHYKRDFSLEKTFIGFNTSYYAILKLGIGYWYYSNLCTYNINAQWHYIYQTENYKYDDNGLNPILSITEYFYNNPTHLQLSRVESEDSKGNMLATQTYFPEDYDTTIFSNLIHKHLISKPIDQRKIYNNKLQNGRLIKYNELGQPIEIYEAEDEKGTELAFNQNNPYSYANAVKKKILEYDPSSHNLVSYKNEGDMETVILWGYNYSKPIAKIENATTELVLDVLTNMNISYEDLQDLTGEALINKMNLFRTNTLLINSMLTTYTYNPLIGMTSTTDPNGVITKYNYD
ncbi:MAG: hypothetical protein CO098_10450, partial [Bacteroidetes bacterium CG_4_9_14_3_um_filter_41_19]